MELMRPIHARRPERSRSDSITDNLTLRRAPLEYPRGKLHVRLEGWATTLMLPPFETRTACAPQGEVILRMVAPLVRQPVAHPERPGAYMRPMLPGMAD